MTPFKGFSEEVFQCCRPSEKIRKPIAKLKELQEVLEPELREFNPRIIGHVSRTKQKGTNYYHSWAWLYFNTFEKEAYRYSQLTVNISPTRLFVGVNVRTSAEYQSYHKQIRGNNQLFDQMLATLSGREWIITANGDWEKLVSRRYPIEELRGELLKPQLFWINACFDKDEETLRDESIVKEILCIFKELYNIYAFASGNDTITQPSPKNGVFKPEITVESEESPLESDQDELERTKLFLLSLSAAPNSGTFHLPGKRDQPQYKRTALEYNLKRSDFAVQGKAVAIFSDKEIASISNKIETNCLAFCKQLEQISSILCLPKDFLKIAYLNPKTDARYCKDQGQQAIFANLAAYETKKDPFFWLFTISRELAYINAHQLGYAFFKELRRIMVFAMNNTETKQEAIC
jgi:hypothetical protein